MTEQNSAVLDEVVREFNRAREGLTSVVGKLSDLESAEQARRDQADAYAFTGASLGSLADGLKGVVAALDGAVGSVSEVLAAARGALQATDAGQLVARLDAIGRSVNDLSKLQTAVAEGDRRQLAAVAQVDSTVKAAAEHTDGRLRALEGDIKGTATAVKEVIARLEEMATLRQENAQLRDQLERIKGGLKPRQLAALGLS